MTMKKRIFISNTLMVLISLLILFGVGGISVMMFKGELMGIVEQNSALADNIYDVQTMLAEQQKSPDDWKVLGDRLSAYNFELYVSDMKHNKQMLNRKNKTAENLEKCSKIRVFGIFDFKEKYRNLSQIGIIFNLIGVKIGVKMAHGVGI